jgi:hypothetical protein
VGKRIEVASWNQKLVAYDGNAKVFEFDCVLGDQMTPTRPGFFRISRKDRHHISAQFGSPMPYSMFFDEGRAIPGGTHVGVRHLAMQARLGGLDNLLPDSKKIASHGCVNLNQDDAKRLYEWATVGTPVHVR